MQYRRFGRTGLPMPVFSCGGMRYQFSWQDVPAWQISQESQDNLEATIKTALAAGINHIETARGYGTSELQLGRIFPQFPRDEIIIQTKVSPKENAADFRRDVEKSLKLLKLDYIDLLGLHGINTPELLHQSIRPGGCLDEARKLQAQGKIRFIGFSTHGDTNTIVKTIETDQFDYVNLHWYYILQDNWAAIEAAKKHDVGVFIISPSDKGGQLYNPPAKLVELCKPLSPMVFNDLFCLSHSQVHTLSIGAAKPADFDEHLKTLPLLDQAAEVLPPILHRLEQEAINCLGEEWVKTWRVGLPTYHDTPGNINIIAILWLRNLVLAYDMLDFAKARYNLLGNGGHWFPGQNAGHLDQLNLKDCLKNSPHADKIPYLLADAHRLLAGEARQRLSSS
ncbi:aldo/keto reductase [Gloeothece verrucosa]|uniref:Aldo/keto reductase n=1 Tax=Gloeothece verrucosa (strain PCC 7822) TaxID=497965 RepID=E0UI67_GLOV7|nr:aldo/keto reductase [Gloeothece verrucosa]ADN15719.1 aldo/keto reductase [Gloeothece verrucosa PCC 7822]